MKIASSVFSIAITTAFVVVAYWAYVRTYEPIKWQWSANQEPQTLVGSILSK